MAPPKGFRGPDGQRIPAIAPERIRPVLSEQQQRAAVFVARGLNYAQSAAQVGVQKNAVAVWMRTMPEFRAAVEAHREEFRQALLSNAVTKLRKSLNRLEQHAKEGNLKAESTLARECGLLVRMPSGETAVAGPANPEDYAKAIQSLVDAMNATVPDGSPPEAMEAAPVSPGTSEALAEPGAVQGDSGGPEIRQD